MITFFHLPFLKSLYACVLHVTDTIYLIVIKCLPKKTTVDVGMVIKYGNTGLCSDAALAMEPTYKGVALFPTSGIIGTGTG